MAATDPFTSDQPEVGRSALRKIAWRRVPVAMLAAAVGARLLARSATRTENRRVADEAADVTRMVA